MIYLGNPSSAPIRQAMVDGHLGMMCAPGGGAGPRQLPGVPWGADNGCFNERTYVGDDDWIAWLRNRAEHAGTCLFAVAPDVVGDHVATWRRSAPWLDRIRALGYPAAYVAQDGLTVAGCPWGAFDVLFVGGSTDWKLGPDAAELVKTAVARGVPAHMGRVNTRRRWRYAEHLGCRSVDGTTLARYPATLPIVLGWQQQRGLW